MTAYVGTLGLYDLCLIISTRVKEDASSNNEFLNNLIKFDDGYLLEFVNMVFDVDATFYKSLFSNVDKTKYTQTELNVIEQDTLLYETVFRNRTGYKYHKKSDDTWVNVPLKDSSYLHLIYASRWHINNIIKNSNGTELKYKIYDAETKSFEEHTVYSRYSEDLLIELKRINNWQYESGKDYLLQHVKDIYMQAKCKAIEKRTAKDIDMLKQKIASLENSTQKSRNATNQKQLFEQELKRLLSTIQQTQN